MQYTSLVERLRNEPDQEALYSEVQSKQELVSAIQDVLSMYNRNAFSSSDSNNSKESSSGMFGAGKMNLVIFQEAAHQIVKIVRIIQFR